MSGTHITSYCHHPTAQKVAIVHFPISFRNPFADLPLGNRCITSSSRAPLSRETQLQPRHLAVNDEIEPKGRKGLNDTIPNQCNIKPRVSMDIHKYVIAINLIDTAYPSIHNSLRSNITNHGLFICFRLGGNNIFLINFWQTDRKCYFISL